jgi:alpha-ketoglutarate-dependent 2,4-dichlorophenoxyacetate dioxygenase
MTTLETARRLHPLFGAELAGVSADRALRAAERAALVAEVSTHGLVVLRNCSLSPEGFLSFARSLGPVWSFASAAGAKAREPRIYDFTNRGRQGEPLPIDHPDVRYLKINEMWHTDTTYVRPGAALSLLAAHVLPETGGDTQFCDTRVLYEALTQELRERIDGAIAHHSLQYSYARAGFASLESAGRGFTGEIVARPLVRRHVSGRTAVWLASHIGAIEGMPPAESEALLAQLTAEATRPERVYSHAWRPGDLLIWDNRCTMHRATPFDSASSVRSMWSCRITDESELAGMNEPPQ